MGNWDGASTQDRLTISRHYEKELITGVVTKRYYAGNRLLATRTGTSLYFIQPDHLGSASAVTDASGQVVALVLTYDHRSAKLGNRSFLHLRRVSGRVSI